jgi:stage V sporulation protein AA
MKVIIYVKAGQNVMVYKKELVLKDVVKLYAADKKRVIKLENEPFYMISEMSQKKTMFSILKVYEAIHRVYPGAEIINIGESDFIVEYKNGPDVNKIKEYLKVAFVCLISFFGAAFTIMTFNEDVSVAAVFDKLYELVLGKTKEGGSILEFFYALGLPIGILAFYNHFRRKESQNDPTPIQVEMRSYEEEINSAMIKNASREGETVDVD